MKQKILMERSAMFCAKHTDFIALSCLPSSIWIHVAFNQIDRNLYNKQQKTYFMDELYKQSKVQIEVHLFSVALKVFHYRATGLLLVK